MRLVDNWRIAHRWFTMRLSALALALVPVWALIPQEWRDSVPKWVLMLLFGGYAMAIMGGRVVKQGSKSDA